MAALSSEKSIAADEVTIEDIHALLRRHGAIVPGDV